VLVLALLRIVNSPFGRVLQAIRENEFRAEAIGYRVVVYRTTSRHPVGAVRHAGRRDAGALAALQRPDTSLSFEVMLDVLLIVVIGGMGTIYGAAIGSGLFVVAQSYLQDLLKLASEAASGLPWLAALLSPDRWLLWLGVLFVLSVYYFPTGIVGKLRARGRTMNDHLIPTSRKAQLPWAAKSIGSSAGRRDPRHRVGRPHAPVVVAWHGLARTGRDMDELAQHLASRGYRVICPDTIGRGLSAVEPAARRGIHAAFYARLADASCAIGCGSSACTGSAPRWAAPSARCAPGPGRAAHEGAHRAAWCSTTTRPSWPSRRSSASSAYAGQPPAFDTVAELEAFYRTVYKPYGWLSDAQWRRLTETSTRRLADGRVTPHYDPAMVRQFTAHDNDYLIWPHYDAIEVPVLCLRGAESDLVLPEVVEAMRHRGPGAAGRLQVIEVPACGHAPALNVPEQLAPVEGFIRAAGA
jgi:pimeloyl-ACP methyl ester carboxylesterase